MNELELKNIQEYLLENGKEYRKNILTYLKWVLEDYDNRKESHSSVVQNKFNNIYLFYIEGIKTKKEWNRISKRGKNNFLIEHKTSKKDGYKSGWFICTKLSRQELENFLKKFDNNDIPNEIMTWEYKMPTEEHFKEAIKLYNESEWTTSKRKVVIDDKEYQLKALSSIAIGIANELDSPANFYMFTTNELKSYIGQTFKNFKIIDSKNNTISEIDEDDEYNGEDDMPNETDLIQPLNQILYGPPVTGKTYNTINKALEIIFQDNLTKEDYENGKIKEERLVELSQNELSEEEKKDIANDSRNLLKACFEKYKNAGQIEFVTFHQSYGYEEFVEGIKAISPDDERNPTDNLIYKVEAGIFKKLCENAKIIKAQTNKLDFDWNRGNIFKMSLGGKSDSEILDWCLDNEYISMGWGNEIDFSSITAQSWESFRDKAKSLYQNLDTDRFTLQAMYAFKEWMKKDDLVFVSLGNLKIVAIGQVIGDYEYKENIDEIRYSQFRKVKWLFIDKSGIPVEKLLNKKLSQQTIYNLDKSYVKKDFLDSLFIENNDSQLKNYVLIIDEINRGNISKIFGELITLIEPSKRIGAEEEIRVKLPYSGDSEEPFGVPSNLYIIGTMNTADRSIAPIDTALRRRFVFEEMAPDFSLLKSIKVKNSDNETDIKLDELLDAINTRIEYLYDRDHTIGHAYLIDVKNLDDLRFAFKNKIIPLLAEYFYEDWENIDLVLNNNGFIKIKEDSNKYLAVVNKKISGKKIYEVSNENWGIGNFIRIYNDNITKVIEDVKVDVTSSDEK